MISNTLDDNRTLSAIGIFFVAVSGCIFVTWRLSQGFNQTIVATVLILTMVQLALVAPRGAIILTMMYLAINGDLRRILMYLAGRTDNDPLLLVAPSVMTVLLANLLMRGHINFESRLSKCIFWLSILMLLQAVNPLQGGIGVGLTGLFLFLCPLSWFWVGQYYGDEKFVENLTFRAFIPMSVIASCYTFYQAIYGVFEYQMDWLLKTGMISLAVKGAIRPTGFFPSPAEMGLYSGTAVVILWAGFLCRMGRKWAFLIPLLLVAAFLQGSRGVIAATLFTCCIMWAITGKSSRIWAIRFVFSLFVGFGGIIYVLMSVGTDTMGGTSVAPIIQHQANIVNDPRSSTLQAHSMMAVSGILMGTFQNPLGWGIGSTTNAAAKVDSQVADMEVDLSNIFISMGVVGGILYAAVIFMIFKRVLKYWTETRSYVAMAMFGICLVMLGHYLTGMLHSLVVFSWFIIGSVEKLTHSTESEVVKLTAVRTQNVRRMQTARVVPS